MMSVSIAPSLNSQISRLTIQSILGLVSLALLATVGWLQEFLDTNQDQTSLQIDELARLPKGEHLKPALLGYHHLGADSLWLKLIQIIGQKQNDEDEYQWIYTALDVITTLDPHYAYAYYVGGNILGDLAQRPDLSNRLLEKGSGANPQVWYIPFLLGYNYYFLMGDPQKGAEYIMQAANLPGGPSYLPGLATRMAAEGGKPETALLFLETRVRETNDLDERTYFVNRMKEVLIERDIRVLEEAVGMYLAKYQTFPMTLTDLVKTRIILFLPREPFEGTYVLDQRTGTVSSSTHPERLRTFHKRKQPLVVYPQIKPSYVFPKTW